MKYFKMIMSERQIFYYKSEDTKVWVYKSIESKWKRCFTSTDFMTEITEDEMTVGIID